MIFLHKVVMHNNHEMDKFKSSKEHAPKMTPGLLKFMRICMNQDIEGDTRRRQTMKPIPNKNLGSLLY